jgi:hypothetical protein
MTDCCKSSEAALHFDATGTVVKDVPDNKRVLYYSFIPSNQNLPVFEFLSAQQTTETIAYLLDLFNRDVRLCNNGVTVQPRYIVTDFSYALINACLQAFNKCSLSRYLNVAMQVMKWDLSRLNILERTYICLCVAHMMKNFSRTLCRLAPKTIDKRRRQYAVIMFALISRTTSLRQAATVYRHVCIVLCSETCTADVVKSQQTLTELLQNGDESLTATELDDKDEPDNSNCDGMLIVNSVSIIFACQIPTFSHNVQNCNDFYNSFTRCKCGETSPTKNNNGRLPPSWILHRY